jgi:hypothetical protein
VTPTILNIDPNRTPSSVTITITGTSFGTTQLMGSVAIVGLPAAVAVQNWSDKEIKAKLPALSSGPIRIRVTVNNQDSNSYPIMILRDPKPTALIIATDAKSLTLRGSGFGTFQSDDSLTINGQAPGKITDWNDTCITFDNPPNSAAIEAGAKVQIKFFLDGNKDKPTLETTILAKD